MSRISGVFKSMQAGRRAAYIPYICAGDPSIEFSLALAKAIGKGGADLFEIGLPFSDPIADGPTIQKAMQRSLASGFKVDQLFGLISSMRSAGMSQPIIVMTYYNPVLQAGPGKFCRKLSDAGGDGILVVDLPPEESGEIDRHAKETGLDVIRLVAPSTDDARLGYLLSKASGFVYAVSASGTTGVRNMLPSSAISTLQRISSKTRLPVALGFGISQPEHVRAAVNAGAAAVVEGSKLISIYSDSPGDEQAALRKIEKHVAEMTSATNLQNR
ncbi:MAG TPA: tryptophan synthase subunit alpha [Thermoplasmata archaeon]|nr:tryptophan synthase subunit alpha [Thermoplasmata archaeon]